MKVFLGADHGGFDLKEELKAKLVSTNHEIHDLGTNSREPVDYPDIAERVGRAVAENAGALGIMVDGAGVGSAMAANRIPGVLAAPAADVFTARNARSHNHANVLCLGSRVIGGGTAALLVETFLQTRPEGGRHQDRVAKIRALDRPGRGAGATGEAALGVDRLRTLVREIVLAILGAGKTGSAGSSAVQGAHALERAQTRDRVERDGEAAPTVHRDRSGGTAASGAGRELVTAEIVQKAGRGGRLSVPKGTLVTPLARDLARELGVTLEGVNA